MNLVRDLQLYYVSINLGEIRPEWKAAEMPTVIKGPQMLKHHAELLALWLTERDVEATVHRGDVAYRAQP